MKQQKEFYAIAQDNNNQFLAEYKNNDRALTFAAKTTDDIRFALIFEKKTMKQPNQSRILLKQSVDVLLKLKLSMRSQKRMDQNYKNQMKVLESATTMPLITYLKKC